MRRIAALCLAAASTACASPGALSASANDALAAPGAAFDAARRAAHGPQLGPVESPQAYAGNRYQDMPQPAPVAYVPAAPNSLWQQGSRSFFNDHRATQIGDILTVQIKIDDNAKMDNTSTRSRSSSSSAGVTNFFGLENVPGQVLPGAFDPTALVNATGESDHNGTGTIDRSETVELTVAAVIVDRLPNGNLVIAGRQEVMINSEQRQLTVSGIIRPEDISATNTINHTQIAEARISYGGRGQISAVQRPNIGQRLTDAVLPW